MRLVLAALLIPTSAFAQERPEAAPAVETAGGSRMSSDYRRQGADDIVSPDAELEASSELVFVTSRGAMAGVPELFFTDVGLWRTRVAYSPMGRVRLTGGVGFVAKQPSTIDEPFWQNAGLGFQFHTSKRSAVGLDLELGQLLADSGQHGGVGLHFQARKRMNEFVSWEGRLGASATNLWLEEPEGDFWFAEAGASGEFQVCWGPCQYRYGATWLGISLGVPVAHRDTERLDPHTRLGLSVGTFVGVSKHWDMLVTLTWVDRGDAENPTTQLPILDGGFDQVQLAFGLIAHVGLGEDSK
jgi:hypothetical protein